MNEEKSPQDMLMLSVHISPAHFLVHYIPEYDEYNSIFDPSFYFVVTF